MILPLRQVQSIVGEPTLDAHPDEDRTSPRFDHSMDANLTPACRHYMNQDELFGGTWSNFAARSYSGESNLGIEQSIAVYSDSNTARQAFTAMKTAARQCRIHYPSHVFGPGYTLTEPDSVTLMAQYPETVNGPGSVSIYALRKQVLVEVGASHFSTDPRIAQAVLALIVEKIPA